MKSRTIMLVLLGAFVGVGASYIVYAILERAVDAVSYVSAISAFMIAVLTLCYVYITSGQLDVTRRQLDEMERQRKFQSQPLPWLSLKGFYVEPTRAFFTPSEKPGLSVQSRYFVEFEVKNIGTSPAVCVDVSAMIVTPDSPDNSIVQGASKRIRVIEDKVLVSVGEREEEPLSLMFCRDEKGDLFRSLLKSDSRQFPVLRTRVLFRNAVGGRFAVYNDYTVFSPSPEIDELIKEKLGTMESYRARYVDEVSEIEKHGDVHSEKSKALFEKLKDDIHKSQKSGDRIKLGLNPVAESFEVMTLSEKEYQDMARAVPFGTLLTHRVTECLFAADADR